jgi:hypothetical protein
MKTNAKHIATALLVIGLTTAQTFAQTSAPATTQTPTNDNTTIPADGPRPDGPRFGDRRQQGRDFRQQSGRDSRQDGSQMDGGKYDQRRADRQNDRDQMRADRGRGPKGGKHGHGQFGHGLTSLSTVTGTVGKLVSNDDMIFDGFMLNAGAATPTTVKFPPHLGEQIQKAVKTGSTVSVTGYADGAPQGETRFRLVSLTSGKTTVFDAPPARPTTPPAAPTLTTTTGKITDYRLDKQGRVTGLVLSDNTVVKIPSHVAYQLTNLATKGAAITVQGYAKPLREGQVQLEKTNILRASVLTINGQQYLVR